MLTVGPFRVVWPKVETAALPPKITSGGKPPRGFWVAWPNVGKLAFENPKDVAKVLPLTCVPGALGVKLNGD